MDKLQGFGEGSGRHTNRCVHCGRFVKRGLMFSVNHFHEEHADIAKKVMSEMYRRPFHSDLAIATAMGLLMEEETLNDYKNG